MSKHLMEYDFNELKFNLYELLNIPINSSIKKIKKKYRKLVTKFHPDKNSKIEEDIFNHLTLANIILTNVYLREKYDLWIRQNINKTHNDFKLNYKKIKPDRNYKESLLIYNKNIKLLEKKHKIKDDNIPIIQKYRLLEKIRKDLNINKEEFKNKLDFDNKFNLRKNPDNILKNNNQLISFQNNKIQSYATTKDYNNLYINDSIITDKFCSLDNAFKLNPNITYSEKNIKSEMSNYDNNTKKFLQSNKFLKIKFTDWK